MHETHDGVTADQLRRDIEIEREQLVDAVGSLRRTVQTTRLTEGLERGLPMLIAGAFVLGFVLSGGVGAAVRLAFRRGRESRPLLEVGRFALVGR